MLSGATMKKRNYALDFLKGIATIAILFHHYQQVTGAVFHYNFLGGLVLLGLYCRVVFPD